MTSPDKLSVERLSRQLLEMQADIDMLKRSLGTPQLPHSSIDGATLETRDATGTTTTSTWGEQPDGTTATVYEPGPPPPAPSNPQVSSLGAAVLVAWDGLFAADAARPADFRLVEVHASDLPAIAATADTKRVTILDTEGDGGQVAIAADGPMYVRLVAVSLSGVRSDPSGEVLGEPGPVVADDLIDGIVGPEKLTEPLSLEIAAAVTQAAQAIQDAATAQATADGSIRTYYQADAPAGLNDTSDLGDLWFDTDTNQAYRWSGAEWQLIQDNAVAEALSAAQDAQTTADGKITSFFAATAPTGEAVGDLWYDTDNGNRVSRWDGTGWQALPFGADAIVARSITALQVAVNGLLAENIAAGQITAAHFVAQLVLASTIIAGTPGASRVQISPTGLVQYNDADEPTVSFGADGANYFTVYDPADPLATLATFDSGGGLTVRTLTVADPEPTFGGSTLSDRIIASPGRTLSWVQPLGGGQTSIPTFTNGQPRAWYEIAFDAEAGRIYRVHTNPIGAVGGSLGIGVHYTDDGTPPTVNSPMLQLHWIANGHSSPMDTLYTSPNTRRVRVLFSLSAPNNVEARARGVGAGLNGVLFWIDDGGPDPAANTKVTTWAATWSRAFRGLGGGATGSVRDTGNVVQGWFSAHGNCATQIGFDTAAIRAALAGATIRKVDLYLHAFYWERVSGGIACIGSHNNDAAPSGFTNLTGFNLAQSEMKRPEAKWVPLPVSIGQQFRDNTIKGLTTDAIFAGTAALYTGEFTGAADITPPTTGPVLRIAYTPA